MSDDEWIGLGASAGRIVFNDLGTDAVAVMSGNVGIGTTGPVTRLTSYGTGDNLTLQSGSDNTGTRHSLVFQGGSTNIEARIQSGNYGSYWGGLDFQVSNQGTAGTTTDSAMFIKHDGNVGIGSTGPLYKLDVAGDLRATGTIYGDLAQGTVTPTGFTEGSVAFAGSGGTLAQDNSNFFWDDTNNRLGIGTTAPSSKLQVNGLMKIVNGGLEISSSGVIKGQSGGASAPAYSFLSNTNMGMYRAGADILGLASGGTGVLFVNSGKVGIGTTAPSQLLHVYDTGSMAAKLETSSSGNAQLQLVNSNKYWYLTTVGTDSSFRIYDGTDRFTISNDGNVGIGSTAPNHKLDVIGNIRSSGDIYASGSDILLSQNGTGYATVGLSGTASGLYVGVNLTNDGDKLGTAQTAWRSLYINTSDNYAIQRSGAGTSSFTNLMQVQGDGDVIVNSGNLGIGTTAPGAKLAMVAGTGVNGIDIVNNNMFEIYFSGTGSSSNIKSENDLLILADTGKTLRFGSNNVDSQVILNNGNLGIGSTAPLYKLDVAGDIYSSGTIYGDLAAGGVGGSAIADDDADTKIQVEESADEDYIRFDTAGTERMTIKSDGNVGIGTTAPIRNLQVQSASTSYITVGEDSNTEAQIGWDAVNNKMLIQTSGHSSPIRFGNDWMHLTNAGNLGIGTTGPGHKLQVAGNVEADSYKIEAGGFTLSIDYDGYADLSWNRQNIQMNAGGVTTLENIANGGGLDLEAGLNGDVTLSPNNGQVALTAQSGGNVGIGTSAPEQKLEVNGSIKLAGRIRQGSLGDLAEMIPLAGCILNPTNIPLGPPEVLARGVNDQAPVILNSEEEYEEFIFMRPEGGDVVVIDEEDGGIRRSYEAHAVNVVGIISTNPAQILRDNLKNAAPVALSGIVPCKVTTENGPIKPGCLLVSAKTPGHAMRADEDPPAGSVVGKALERLDEDKEVGVVDVLVMMQ